MSTKGFKTLAEAISTSRKKLGITQRELSRRTNIDNNTIAKIEKGERKKPNVLSLKKLAFALDIDSDKLLKLAGYTKEEIKIANDDASVNAFQRRDDKKIIWSIYNREDFVKNGDKRRMSLFMAWPYGYYLVNSLYSKYIVPIKAKSKK